MNHNDVIDIIFLGLAIHNITRIITTVDLFEGARNKFREIFPRIGKFIICRYCQGFWFSWIGIYFYVNFDNQTYKIIVMALALHNMINLYDRFYEKYTSGEPTNIYAVHRREKP